MEIPVYILLYLQILDKRVSRNHATLEIKDGKLILIPVCQIITIYAVPPAIFWSAFLDD